MCLIFSYIFYACSFLADACFIVLSLLVLLEGEPPPDVLSGRNVQLLHSPPLGCHHENDFGFFLFSLLFFAAFRSIFIEQNTNKNYKISDTSTYKLA